MLTYIIKYTVGNGYRYKKIKAETMKQACKMARLKETSIVDIDIEEYHMPDKYQLRDF